MYTEIMYDNFLEELGLTENDFGPGFYDKLLEQLKILFPEIIELRVNPVKQIFSGKFWIAYAPNYKIIADWYYKNDKMTLKLRKENLLNYDEIFE